MPNPIKIYSVVSKGCIFFDGSTVQPKFLGTILCEPHPTLSDRVIVYRTDRQSRTNSAVFRTIFRKLKIGRIQNVLGEYLVDDLGYDRDQVIAYINNEANKTDVVTSGQSFTVGSSLDFIRDETNTSILFSNGDHYGVNAVRAELKENGLIGIFPARGDVELYEVDHSIVTINSTTPAGDAQSVVNSLNALFTMSATPAPFPIPTFSLDDGEDVTPLTIDTGIDTEGMIRNLTDGTKYHGPRLYTGQTLNQPGEYFTFEALNTVASNGPLLGLGLYDANSDDISEIGDDSLSNSGTHGYWWSVWLYNYNGYTSPWTTYGSNSGLNYGPGWNGPAGQQFRYSDAEKGFRSPENAPAKFRVGITDEGFVGVWYWDQENVNLSHGYGDRSNDWILLARSSAPLPLGEYGLLVKLPTDAIQILPGSFERFALEDPAPTLYYRYIESPDNSFHYPLFSSEEEANYVDLQNGGTGSSHAHVYVDDTSGTTWYMPDTGGTMNGTSAPLVPGIAYTEIPSLTDAALAPSAFSGLDLTVNEGESVNYQTQPQDTAYTTTFSGLPAGLIDANGGMIQGSAPEVTGDNVANPSDTYTITVTRTNSYGSSTGTFDIIVNNLTVPVVTPISGFTLVSGSTPLVDSNTLADGSVVALDDLIQSGNRLHIDSGFLTNNVLPALVTSDAGNPTDPNVEKFYVGIPKDDADFSNGISEADFLIGVMYQRNGSSSIRSRTISNGVFRNSMGMGASSSLEWEIVLQNYGTELELGIGVSSSNPENNQSATVESVWSSSYQWYPVTDESRQVVMGISNGTMDISTTGLNELANPAPPSNILTPWTKALDFSGSAQRAAQVSTSSSYNALRMRHFSGTVDPNPTSGLTSDQGSACPWATAIVFRSDANYSNQHIWNQGEGAGSTDDNIYLRVSESGVLYFGWGRSGSLNECALGNVNSSTGWHGVYIAHDGTRLSGSNATASNLADAFSIRRMGSEWAQPFGTLGAELSSTGNWVKTGGRMDRRVDGDFTIGGRGSNRSFHGKVAAMTVTTLQRGVAMPDDAEIKMLITDPNQWVSTYRVGQQFRTAGSSVAVNWNSASLGSKAQGVQMWLMGDTGTDSYSNMIRNRVYPSDQNYTKLNMLSMQSNDIQTVNIPGLSD